MKHWTQASTGDFSYSISLDFFTQIEDRMMECDISRKELSDKLDISPSAVTQVLNTPPENPKTETLVQYARALGQKVAIIAYDDDDPPNDKGPIFSGIFAKCWEAMGKPRDLSFVLPISFTQTMETGKGKLMSKEFTFERKPPQSEQGGLASGDLNQGASGL